MAILCWQGSASRSGLSAIGIPISIGLTPYGGPPGHALRPSPATWPAAASRPSSASATSR